MDLSLEPYKYRISQIDKTVKLCAKSFLKVRIYLLRARYICILDIVSTSYSLCQYFTISLNIGQETMY